jgi:hypothetical protein
MHMLEYLEQRKSSWSLMSTKEKITTANLQRDIDFRETNEDDRQQMVDYLI